ncbi:MAG TPA: hypothetical protein VN903_03705, partial [Polyangia bacterium]|nr:hypothetical protein [Polyangia bacterium]
MARKQRRRRRSREVGRPLRLGVLLVGLVGINVYVFFFNHGTAPREILNMQSTSKTFESTRQEALAADVRKAGELVASSSTPKPVQAPSPHEAQVPPPAQAQAPSPREAGRGAARGAAPAAAPAFKIPFAPPPEPAAVAVRAPQPAAPPAIKVPFAPPPEDEGDAPDAQTGVEKKFAANDTLGAVLAREGFGSAAPAVIAALAKLADPRSIRGGQKYVVRLGDDGSPEAFEYQPTPALRYLVERDEVTETAVGKWTARKLEASVEIKTAQAGGTVESSLYESVQKAGEST